MFSAGSLPEALKDGFRRRKDAPNPPTLRPLLLGRGFSGGLGEELESPATAPPGEAPSAATPTYRMPFFLFEKAGPGLPGRAIERAYEAGVEARAQLSATPPSDASDWLPPTWEPETLDKEARTSWCRFLRLPSLAGG